MIWLAIVALLLGLALSLGGRQMGAAAVEERQAGASVAAAGPGLVVGCVVAILGGVLVALAGLLVIGAVQGL